MKRALPNGIVIDDQEAGAPSLAAHARSKGFTDVRAFVATHPNGEKNYVLVQGQDAIYENKSLEAVAVHIDMMAADRDLPGKAV